jgi:hypothetical protein
MEQLIHGHFREAHCMVVILEKPITFVVKIAKISTSSARASRQRLRFSDHVSVTPTPYLPQIVTHVKINKNREPRHQIEQSGAARQFHGTAPPLSPTPQVRGRVRTEIR